MTFSVGMFNNKVIYDVLRVKLFLILGHIWLFTGDVHHVAHSNTYSILKGGTRICSYGARSHTPNFGILLCCFCGV